MSLETACLVIVYTFKDDVLVLVPLKTTYSWIFRLLTYPFLRWLRMKISGVFYASTVGFEFVFINRELSRSSCYGMEKRDIYMSVGSGVE